MKKPDVNNQEADKGFYSRLTHAFLQTQTGDAEKDIIQFEEAMKRLILHVGKRNPWHPEFTLEKARKLNSLGYLDPPLEDHSILKIVEEVYGEIRENIDRGTVGLVGRSFLPNILAEVVTNTYHLLATPKSNTGKGGEVCYLYVNGTFIPAGADFVAEESHRLLSYFESSKPCRIAEVLSLIKITEAKDQDSMNNRAMDLINCKNGMLDWKTGELLPHDPKYNCTFQVNSDYDPGATSQLLDDFFSSVFNEDAILLVEEFVGLLLLPTSQFHKCFIAIGPGGNGKSTFLSILENFMGKQSLSFESLHELQTNTFSRANLLDKVANIHHEVSSQMLESTGIFKSLVSGDTISGQFKHQNSFTFTPFARLIFAANEFPKSEDRTDAFYQRLIFVEFPKTFRGSNEEITNFAEKACADPVFCSALLNRALQGLCRLMERGKFSSCSSSERLVKEYQVSNASSVQAFLQDAFEFGPTYMVKRGEVYGVYQDWTERNGMKPKGRNKALAEIKSSPGIEEIRGDAPNRDWFLQGIRWNQEYNPNGISEQVEQYGKQIG